MRTVRDDFTGKEHRQEENVSLQISFANEKIFYKAVLDISPKTYLELFGNKKVSFGKYIKHKTEEQKAEYNGAVGHYEPVKNAGALIASMATDEVKA